MPNLLATKSRVFSFVFSGFIATQLQQNLNMFNVSKDVFTLILCCWWKQKTASKICFDEKHRVFCSVETNLSSPAGRKCFYWPSSDSWSTKLCLASTGLLVTIEPKKAGKIFNRKLTLNKFSWRPFEFCLFFASQHFWELKFRSLLETPLQWRYRFVDYKTATGLVSMKNVSFFVVASFPTCRVLRSGSTRICLLKRLVPAFFKCLKPDC